MAWPTGNAVDAVTRFDRTASAIKQTLESRITGWASGNASSSQVIGLWQGMKARKAEMQAAASVSGVADMARQIKGDPALDVSAEYTALAAAIDALITQIQNSFPTANGYLQAQQFSGGEIVDREFTPAQTAAVRTSMQAVVDLID